MQKIYKWITGMDWLELAPVEGRDPAIATAANLASCDAVAYLKSGKKCYVDCTIWDNKIVFSVRTYGRNPIIVSRYACDLLIKTI